MIGRLRKVLARLLSTHAAVVGFRRNLADSWRQLARHTVLYRRAMLDSQANADLKDFFENAIVPLHCVGADGVILRANRAQLEMLGYSAAEYIGHPARDFYHRRAEFDAIFARLLVGEAVKGASVRLRAKDGSVRNVIFDADARLEGGRFLHARCLMRDVSAQEEVYRRLVDAVRDYAIFMLDPDGRVLTWNEGARRIKGYSAHEIVGQHFSAFYSELERGTKPDLDLQVAAEAGRLEDEGWRRRSDGSCFWANVVITPMRDDSGRLLGFSQVTRDLSERKQVEDALKASHDRFQKQAVMFDAALSSSLDFHYIFDRFQRFIYVNRTLLNLWGLTLDQVIGKSFEELGYPSELVELHRQQLDEVLRERRAVRGENPYTNASGKHGQYEYTFTPVFGEDGSVQAISGTTRDVTERKRVEESLKKSETFLDSVVENLPNMLFIKDAKELRFVRFNRAGEELIGYSRTDLMGKNDYDFFPPDQADHFVAMDREVLSGRSIVDIPEEHIATRDKGTRILHTRKIPILGSDGTPEYLLGISEDITERKWSEEERLRVIREQAAIDERRRETERAMFLAEASTLLASSLDYRTTLKDLAQLTVPALADWCTVTILKEDRTKERVAIVHRESEKRALIDELVKYYPASADESDDGIGQVILSGKSLHSPVITDSMLASAAHDERHLEIMRGLGVHSCIVAPILLRGKTLGAISVVSGRPDQMYNENDVAMLEELGRRAAVAIDNAFLYEKAHKAVSARDEFMSIASHELKTPLTSLKLQAQIRARDVKRGEYRLFSPDRLPKLIADDEKQLNRLTRLVDDMLDVSRVATGKMSYSLEYFDLSELARETLARISPQVEATKSTVSYESKGPVYGRWDRFRIEQVIVNLLTNALKYGAGSPIAVRVEAVGEYAELSVQDRGIGIAPKDQARIFEQFERAISPNLVSGLGLGLYISRKIAEAHEGTITVQSELGQGSVFTLSLPLQVRQGPASEG